MDRNYVPTRAEKKRWASEWEKVRALSSLFLLETDMVVHDLKPRPRAETCYFTRKELESIERWMSKL